MNEYPTDEELNKIEKWDVLDYKGLLDFVKSLWWCDGHGFFLTGNKVLKLELHTWGWSGNESIIYSLEKSMFWALYWEKSTRGGHYYFKIYKLKESKK